MAQKQAKSTLTKGTLTKGATLSLGTVEKEAMPELKADLTNNNNEKRTTIYLEQSIYKAAKQYAVKQDLTLKEYFSALLRNDLQAKGEL